MAELEQRHRGGIALTLTSCMVGTPSAQAAAGCELSTPYVHKSTKEVGRINFKPLVECKTDQSKLVMRAEIYRYENSKWVRMQTTLTTLDHTKRWRKLSVSMPCVDGRYRGRAQYAGGDGEWSKWETNNSVIITCEGGGCAGGGGGWSTPQPPDAHQ